MRRVEMIREPWYGNIYRCMDIKIYFMFVYYTTLTPTFPRLLRE